MRVINSVELTQHEILIRYEESVDTRVDSRIVVVKWKSHPSVRRLTEAFQAILANYILSENHTLDLIGADEMNDLFSKLLKDDPRDLTS